MEYVKKNGLSEKYKNVHILTQFKNICLLFSRHIYVLIS